MGEDEGSASHWRWTSLATGGGNGFSVSVRLGCAPSPTRGGGWAPQHLVCRRRPGPRCQWPSSAARAPPAWRPCRLAPVSGHAGTASQNSTAAQAHMTVSARGFRDDGERATPAYAADLPIPIALTDCDGDMCRARRLSLQPANRCFKPSDFPRPCREANESERHDASQDLPKYTPPHGSRGPPTTCASPAHAGEYARLCRVV